LLIKGALPGANGALLYVRKSVTARERVAEETKPAKGGKK
jgi:ribosomal protein L3